MTPSISKSTTATTTASSSPTSATAEELELLEHPNKKCLLDDDDAKKKEEPTPASTSTRVLPEHNKTFSSTFTSGKVTAVASVVEFGKSYHSTGICFLDHMVDQLTSHGQLGVTLKVTSSDEKEHQPHVDYAAGLLDDEKRPHDADIFKACGTALGGALRQLVIEKSEICTKGEEEKVKASMVPVSSSSSIFCCPLDEAFCEATLNLQLQRLCDSSAAAAAAATVSTAASSSNGCEVSLAPYGTMPPQGRRWIGCYRCNLTPVFFQHLVEALNGTSGSSSSDLDATADAVQHNYDGVLMNSTLQLRKVRGHNAHHIVESSFKAFARVFRACLDGFNDTGIQGHTMKMNHGQVQVGENRLALRRNRKKQDRLLLQQQDDYKQTEKQQDEKKVHRTGSRSRTTKETTIDVNVDLDRESPDYLFSQNNTAKKVEQFDPTSTITTGVELMDLLLGEIRKNAGFQFNVLCNGDTYIDDHHTVEDVAITVGQCFNQALGSKAGLARMGCAQVAIEGNHTNHVIRCVMDLSNRPYFEWNLPLDEEYVGGDIEGFAAMKRGGNNNNGNDVDGNTDSTTTATKTPGTMLCGSALTCEMLQHVFESLTIETRATVHLELMSSLPSESGYEYVSTPGHTRALAIAAARAFGTALSECVRVDPRRAGKVASSKGTLSV